VKKIPKYRSHFTTNNCGNEKKSKS